MIPWLNFLKFFHAEIKSNETKSGFKFILQKSSNSNHGFILEFDFWDFVEKRPKS